MPRLVRWIATLTAAHLALGMMAYAHFLATDSYSFLGWFFWIPGTVFFLLATAVEFLVAVRCSAGFDADEPMRLSWSMIALAALARFVGTVMIAVRNWHLSWITGQAAHGHAMVSIEGLGHVGAVIGGPLSMIFLAVGLGRALVIQRRFGVLGGLTRADRVLLMLILAFTLSQVIAVIPLLSAHAPLSTELLWLSDPLLALLLVQAVLVRRSAARVGQGLLARCWGMYVTAIVATSAGDAGIWAAGRGLLPPSLTPLSWYIWFVAAAAFACAPAYQLAAMSLPLTHPADAGRPDASIAS